MLSLIITLELFIAILGTSRAHTCDFIIESKKLRPKSSRRMTFSPQLLCFKHGIEWLASFCLFSSGHKIRYRALGQLLPCAYLATRRECYLSGTPWWFPEGMPQVFLMLLCFHTIIDLGDLERPHSIKQQHFFLSATTIFMRTLIKNNTTFCHHRLGLLIFDGSRQPTVPEPH